MLTASQVPARMEPMARELRPIWKRCRIPGSREEGFTGAGAAKTPAEPRKISHEALSAFTAAALALVFVSPAPGTFDGALPLLRSPPLVARGRSRLRRGAFLRHLGGAFQERHEPGADRVAILGL